MKAEKKSNLTDYHPPNTTKNKLIWSGKAPFLWILENSTIIDNNFISTEKNELWTAPELLSFNFMVFFVCGFWFKLTSYVSKRDGQLCVNARRLQHICLRLDCLSFWWGKGWNLSFDVMVWYVGDWVPQQWGDNRDTDLSFCNWHTG